MNVAATTTSTATGAAAATRRVAMLATLLLLGLLAVLAGRAAADSPGGPPTSTLLALGSTDDRIVVKTHPNDSSTVRTLQVSFAEAQTTGWHTHPGPAIVTIKSGTFTLRRAAQTGCTERPLGPGDVFLDDGTAHTLTARSAGVVLATLVTPMDAGAPTVPLATAPPC